MVRIDVCRSENELETAFNFLLQHRRDFLPAWNLCQLLFLLNGCFFLGEVIAAWNENNEMVALLGFSYAPPENNANQADKEQVRLRIALISEPYRRTMLFYQGMSFLARHLSHAKIEVKKIDIVVPEGNEYLNRLISKFANLESTVSYKFMGAINHYSVTLEQLNKFCSRPKSLVT